METDRFVDERDGKVYKTVRIGSQIWMAENLNFATNEGSWSLDKNPYFAVDGTCCLYNDPKHIKKYDEKYGRLYDWNTAMKVAPVGWHLPSQEEWEELIRILGGNKKAYDMLIEGGASGFNALNGGSRVVQTGEYGSFYYIGEQSTYWTSNEDTGEEDYSAIAVCECINFFWMDKTDAYSVRCTKNK